MSEAGTTNRNQTIAQTPNRVAELKVSGHLMTLDSGVFCVFQAPGPAANDKSGLPAVRISLPPGAPERADILTISTFHNDGWLDAKDGAALVRVGKGPMQVLVTVYQAPTAPPEAAPRLQVMRLGADQAADVRPGSGAQAGVPLLSAGAADVVIHVQRTGDQASRFNEWAGMRGSRQWIEGFSLAPHDNLRAEDIEYQAVLGRGWLSPWIEGGKFCGSRGMALPLLGLKVRLKGGAAKSHECSYSASFVDGSFVGPVPGGETCEAESLAALEAFQIMIRPRGGAASARPAAPRAAAKRAAAKKAAR